MAANLKVLARPAFKNRARNPYNYLLYAQMRRCGADVSEYSSSSILRKPWDILHIHWPESLLETGGVTEALYSFIKNAGLIALARQRGAKVVWTIHDLRPHDYVFPRIEQRFWDAFLRHVDAIIALSHVSLASAVSRMPTLQGLPAFVIPHGHYRDCYPNTVTRAEARTRLGIADSTTVIAHLGHIRPYKNVRRLIEAFREIDVPDSLLMVCGRISKRIDLTAELQEAAGGDPRVQLKLRHVDDEDIQLFVNAADLLVFPYRNILNSGSALLALSFNRPVLVPNQGSIPELVTSVGEDWVQAYEGEFDAACLRRAIDWACHGNRAETAPLDALDWLPLARQTIDAYHAILAQCGNSASALVPS